MSEKRGGDELRQGTQKNQGPGSADSSRHEKPRGALSRGPANQAAEGGQIASQRAYRDVKAPLIGKARGWPKQGRLARAGKKQQQHHRKCAAAIFCTSLLLLRSSPPSCLAHCLRDTTQPIERRMSIILAAKAAQGSVLARSCTAENGVCVPLCCSVLRDPPSHSTESQ